MRSRCSRGTVKRLFHFGSAASRCGLVAGFYVRGIGLEYRAGWESTFLGASQVRALRALVVRPGLAADGHRVARRRCCRIEALHWRDGAGGGPAAPWIHLMAATAILYVIVPRLLLALASTLRLARAQRALEPPESLLPYARRVLAATDAALPVAAPCDSPATRTHRTPRRCAASERVLHAVFGPDARIEFAPAIAYGDEAAFAAAPASARGSDVEVLLFSLAATPEVGKSRCDPATARDDSSRSRAGSRLLVLVDETPYLPRMRRRCVARGSHRRTPRGLARLRALPRARAVHAGFRRDPGGRSTVPAGDRRPGASLLRQRRRMTRRATTVSLALLSHTNVGKTTLARTLLRQDIGAVIDRAHVTERRRIARADADARRAIELVLWDTPGFGDSVRLLRRLEQSGNPLGWFLCAGVGPLCRPCRSGAASRRCAPRAIRPTSCCTSSTPPRIRRLPATSSRSCASSNGSASPDSCC